MNNSLFEELKSDIQKAYEEGVTLEHAERLAAKCLHIQITLSNELSLVELDARMNKSGLKAVRAAIYLDSATKTDKKPSDVMLEAIVNTNEIVKNEQDRLDAAEVKRDELERAFSVCKEAHLYFRGVAKGRFE